MWTDTGSQPLGQEPCTEKAACAATQGLPSRDVESIAQGIIRGYAQRAHAALGPLAMARGLVAVAPYFLDVLQIGAHLGAPSGGWISTERTQGMAAAFTTACMT